MDSAIKKFKRKIIIECLTKAILIGLTLPFIALGVVMLIFKIKRMEYNLILYLLIALGIAVLISLILFFIFKPNKKAIAKRLDKELNLNERVLTMIECENEDGVIATLQREDTCEKLNSIPTKNLKFKLSIVLIIVFVMSCGVLTTGFAYPKYVEPAPIEEEYQSDDYVIQCLLNLIKKVNNTTDIEQSIKDGMVKNLRTLVDEIQLVQYESQKEAAVNKCIDGNNTVVLINTTADDISTIFKKANIQNITGRAVVEMGRNLEVYSYDKTSLVLENIKSYLKTGITEECITDLRVNVKNPLNDSVLDKEDGLVKGFIELSNQLNTLSGDANAVNNVDAIYDPQAKIILDALKIQVNAANLKNEVETELRRIFEMEIVDDKTSDTGSSDTEPETPESDEPTYDNDQGGVGSGEQGYANVTIYDPTQDKVVNIGATDSTGSAAVNRYDNMIGGQFEDGVYDEEYYSMYESYYEYLLGISKTEN